jgi:hypothetical protein
MGYLECLVFGITFVELFQQDDKTTARLNSTSLKMSLGSKREKITNLKHQKIELLGCDKPEVEE